MLGELTSYLHSPYRQLVLGEGKGLEKGKGKRGGNVKGRGGVRVVPHNYQVGNKPIPMIRSKQVSWYIRH